MSRAYDNGPSALSEPRLEIALCGDAASRSYVGNSVPIASLSATPPEKGYSDPSIDRSTNIAPLIGYWVACTEPDPCFLLGSHYLGEASQICSPILKSSSQAHSGE